MESVREESACDRDLKKWDKYQEVEALASEQQIASS